MAILVFDDFNGANGTDIADHAPDIDIVGTGWNQDDPNLVELDGSGAVKFAATGDSAWIDTGQSDQIVTATINAGGADNRFQLVARSDNQRGTAGTNYSLNMRQAVSGQDNLFLFKRINGSASLLASVQVSFNASQSNEFELSAIGSTIAAKVDGVEVISVTDSEITTGNYAGFYHALYTDGNLRVYDFEVDDGIFNPVSADVNYTISAPTFTASADAWQPQPSAGASFTINAPSFSVNGSATLPQPIIDVSFVVNTPSFTANATANLPQPIGDIDFTVNAPSFNAEASATIPGFSASVAYTVNAPTFSASANVTLSQPTATVDYSIAAPAFNASAKASLPQPIADVSYTIAAPQFSVDASATLTGYVADVNYTVPAPTFSAEATATLPQPESTVSYTISTPSVSIVAIVGGIAIIVDKETNINQRVLSNNINAPILSNNING